MLARIENKLGNKDCFRLSLLDQDSPKSSQEIFSTFYLYQIVVLDFRSEPCTCCTIIVKELW